MCVPEQYVFWLVSGGCLQKKKEKKKNLFIYFKLDVQSGRTNRPAEILATIKNRYNFRSSPSLGAKPQIKKINKKNNIKIDTAGRRYLFFRRT